MKARSRWAGFVAFALMLGVISAIGAGTAMGQTADPTTVTVSAVTPPSTDVGSSTGSQATVTVHFGDDVPAGSHTLTLAGEATDHTYLYMLDMTGGGYSNEDCDYLHAPTLSYVSGCQWTGSPGNTYTFTLHQTNDTGSTPGSYQIVATLTVADVPAVAPSDATEFVVVGETTTSSTATTSSTTTTMVLDRSTLTVPDAVPDPLPVGGTWTFHPTVHFGNDVTAGDQVTMVVDLDRTGGSVSFTGLSTDAPGAVCTPAPAPALSETCVFTVATGQDYTFAATVNVAADATAPSQFEVFASVTDFDGADPHLGWSSMVNIGAAAGEEPTTTEATTTSITVAPTSIVSTTVAATTTENTLPNTGPNEDIHRNGFLGLALVLFGIVLLSGAAVFGEYRKQ